MYEISVDCYIPINSGDVSGKVGHASHQKEFVCPRTATKFDRLLVGESNSYVPKILDFVDPQVGIDRTLALNGLDKTRQQAARRMTCQQTTKERRFNTTRAKDGYRSVVADVAPGKSATSDGQTLPNARRRIRQSIALLLEIDEQSFDIHEEYRLPREVMASLKRYQIAQAKLRKDAEEATLAERTVAQVLAALGVSRRDAGDLLGLSGARVQQVLSGGASAVPAVGSEGLLRI